LDYILGKNDSGWYVWSRHGNAWLTKDGKWSQNGWDNVYWTDAYDVIRVFRNQMGGGGLEVGTVTNI
jgi:hypothetical protein